MFTQPFPLTYFISARRQLFFCVDYKMQTMNTLWQPAKSKMLSPKHSELQNCSESIPHHKLHSGKQINTHLSFPMHFRLSHFHFLLFFFFFFKSVIHAFLKNYIFFLFFMVYSSVYVITVARISVTM